MSDSDNWDSDEEQSQASRSLAGLNINYIKEKCASQRNAAADGASGFKISSGNGRSGSNFLDEVDSLQNRSINTEVGNPISSGGFDWTPNNQTAERNGRIGGGTCYNCNGSGHMSRDCTEPRKPQTCNSCHEEGHISKFCPSGGGNSKPYGGNRRGGSAFKCEVKCYKCNQEGHIASKCTSEEGPINNNADIGSFNWKEKSNGTSHSGGNNYGQHNQQERQRDNRCFNCQDIGHQSRDCQQPKKPKTCNKCGEEGHLSRECTSGGDGSYRGFSNRGKQEQHGLNEPVGDYTGSDGKKGCFKCGEFDHISKDCMKTDDELKSMGVEVKPPPVTYIPVEIDDADLFGQGVTAGNNFSAYSNIPVQVSGKDVPKAINSFSVSGLRSMLLDNVKKAHYSVPTPIQKTAIPIIMKGRDVMGCAQTGSGKTAAYLLPILHYILENNIGSYAYENPMKPTALILAPTRELAIQIYNEARKFASGSILKICLTYGGVSVSYQHKKFQEGCHVLVATPGRLNDFVNKDRLSFEALKFLVLDEADRMLDMGFLEDVKKIVSHSSTPCKEDRQTLMFSATFSEEIQGLAKEFLNDYIFVVIGIVGAANADVKQEVLQIEGKDKRETLHLFLRGALEENAKEKILVFVSTKRMADFLAAYLSQQDISTTSIHGDRYQNQREEALNEFKIGIRNVLIATAVAARGLDIKGVGYVVNVDLPTEIDEYVHRIGRTGRVGNQGNAISYFDPAQDSNIASDLVKILNDAEQNVPDWLLDFTRGGGGGESARTGRGALFGASKDIRKNLDFVNHETEFSGASHFGGPSSVQEEEQWD